MRSKYLSFFLLAFSALLIGFIWARYQQRLLPPVEPLPGSFFPEPSTSPAIAEIKTVRITANGFEPKTLTIHQNDTVKWSNEDAKAHWPATDPHPAHTGYPEGHGCLGSSFDSCQGLTRNESWQFRFTKIGRWPYHDHLNPGLEGEIIVE